MSSPIASSRIVTTPPSSTFTAHNLSGKGSPATSYPSPKSTRASPKLVSSLPNQYQYYSEFLSRTQFNLILVNSAVKLLRILYEANAASIDEVKLRFCIVEILRRSKTSTQSLQLACFYIAKLIHDDKGTTIAICPKKLFLTLTILASKFNQDHNYSFKSWLKICGTNANGDNINLQELRQLEMQTLGLLDHQLYLNHVHYENWCNILMIFSYDFIKVQKIDVHQPGDSHIQFESNDGALSKWGTKFQHISFDLLDSVAIRFLEFFNNQLGGKVLIGGVQCGTMKRSIDEVDVMSKKARVQ